MPIVQDIFSTLGAVSEVRIVKDRATGNSAGSAFVKFEDHQAAAIALKTINGRVLYNKVRGLSTAILMVPSGLFRQMHVYSSSKYSHVISCWPLCSSSVHHCLHSSHGPGASLSRGDFSIHLVQGKEILHQTQSKYFLGRLFVRYFP